MMQKTTNEALIFINSTSLNSLVLFWVCKDMAFSTTLPKRL